MAGIFPIIILQINNDNEKEFITNIYMEFYPILKYRTYKIIQNENIVEDIINETIIKLIEKVNVIVKLEKNQLASYIITTNKRIAINYIKKNSLEKNKTYYGLEEDIADSIIDTSIDVEDIICNNEKYKNLTAVISMLSERDRDLLYYKYILELNDNEISKIMDIRKNNIRQYLTRAKRRALRLIIEGDEFIECK